MGLVGNDVDTLHKEVEHSESLSGKWCGHLSHVANTIRQRKEAWFMSYALYNTWASSPGHIWSLYKEHFQEFPKSNLNLHFLPIFKKTAPYLIFQSFRISENRPNRSEMYARVPIGQCGGGRIWGRIMSRIGFRMQMYSQTGI